MTPIPEGLIYEFHYADGQVEEHVFPRSCYGFDITLPHMTAVSPVPGVLPSEIRARPVRFRFDTSKPHIDYPGGLKPVYREVGE